MKIFNYRALMMAMAVFSLVYLSGCGEDEDADIAPRIEVQQPATDVIVEPGATAQMQVYAEKGPEGANLREVRGYYTQPAIAGTTPVDFNGGAFNDGDDILETGNEATFTSPVFDLTFPTAVEGDFVFTFEVEDRDGEVTTTTRTVTVQAAQDTTPVDTTPDAPVMETVTLSIGDEAYFAHSLIDTDPSLTENQANGSASSIDFVFAYSSGTMTDFFLSADLAASDDWNGSPGEFDAGINKTQFYAISTTPNEFDALNDESQIEGIVNGGTLVQWDGTDQLMGAGLRIGTGNDNGDYFEINDVFGVEFADGTHALVKVTSFTSNGSITFDIKLDL